MSMSKQPEPTVRGLAREGISVEALFHFQTLQGKDGKKRVGVKLSMDLFTDHDIVTIRDGIDDKTGKRIFAVYSNSEKYARNKCHVGSFEVPAGTEICVDVQKGKAHRHGTLSVIKEHGNTPQADVGALLIGMSKGVVKIDRFEGNDTQHVLLAQSAEGMDNQKNRSRLEKRQTTTKNHADALAEAREGLTDRATHYKNKQDFRGVRTEQQEMDTKDHAEDRRFGRKTQWACHQAAMEEAKFARLMAREQAQMARAPRAQANYFVNMRGMQAYQQSFQNAMVRAQESVQALGNDFAGMQWPGASQPGLGVVNFGAVANQRTPQPQGFSFGAANMNTPSATAKDYCVGAVGTPPAVQPPVVAPSTPVVIGAPVQNAGRT